jgi:hypothetical protein
MLIYNGNYLLFRHFIDICASLRANITGLRPRLRGINHIVQVVRRPTDHAAYISESASSRGGVVLTPLSQWLDSHAAVLSADKAWAVDSGLWRQIGRAACKRRSANWAHVMMTVERA